MIKAPKKLIEVALPLKAINEAAAREKSIRHGHPSTLHLWWARRPLAAARAVLFAQLVNDPGGERGWDSRKGLTKAAAKERRDRLFRIIEDLVKWENTGNEEVLERARAEIARSWRETCEANPRDPRFDPDRPPAFHDPFGGGGAIPLEAQRLGLEAWSSDLNPVAVAIQKAMIEIPPRFAGREPVGGGSCGNGVSPLQVSPGSNGGDAVATSFAPSLFPEETRRQYPGAAGLAEDVRRYGAWMREEAKKRIGHLYPTIEVTAEMAAARPDLKPYVGKSLTVIAWLWARTVESPHPAYAGCETPLVSSFVLSSKKGKEAWVEVVTDGRSWHFEVRTGKPPQGAENGTKTGRGSNFKCILSGAQLDAEYVRREGCAKRMGKRLMAIVCEGDRGRIYISPIAEHAEIANEAKPEWRPATKLPDDPRNFWTPNYGLTTYGDLFTDRQLVALNTFLDLVEEAREKVRADAVASHWADDGIPLADGGSGPTAYADAVAVYLALGIDRLADLTNSICPWSSSATQTVHLFGRQAIPMSWDFAENNIFGNAAGDYKISLGSIVKVIAMLGNGTEAHARQADAQTQAISQDKVVSTDPPYYDNVSYADWSDFFYVWMRRGLRNIYPDLFATIETPKDEELVASPYRHGGAEKAEAFFMDGMTATLKNLGERAHPGFPVTIYYAFKQSDTDAGGTSNAGWESFLEAVLAAGFMVTGTWPMRTERPGRMIGNGANALASSIVLVCRKRPADAPSCERRDFLRELRAEMPEAIEAMTGGDENASPVAPVDFPQAIIGPGMEIFSKYAEVVNANGSRMTVHDAIVEINRFLDPGDGFDAETQFCLDWFKVYRWGEGPSGDAITMAQGKGLSVNVVVDAGVLLSRGGRTRLVHWRDYPADYDPLADKHRPAWEALHHLVRLHQTKGAGAAGAFLALVAEQGEAAHLLAYQLYTACERKGLAEDARPYNELAAAWEDLLAAAARAEAAKPKKPDQLELGLL